MKLAKKYPKAYAVKNKNEAIRLRARSGGVFQSLVHEILKDNGVVYGCLLNENLTAVHCRITDLENAKRLSGSKYVQSNLGKTFLLVMKDLTEGKKVLFSGTPCQVDGLKSFLWETEQDNLLLVDIICHGVPSPAVWKDYITWVENRKHKKIQAADFRDKKFGWHDHIETLYFKEGGEENSKVYTRLFYSHCSLRPSCFQCPYKSIHHPGDITLADFWGIDYLNADFNDDKGVSLVLINNDKGGHIFQNIEGQLDYFECSPLDCPQKPLYSNFEVPKERSQFWIDYKKKSFGYIAQKYGGYEGKMTKLRRWVKQILPKNLVQYLKKIRIK